MKFIITTSLIEGEKYEKRKEQYINGIEKAIDLTNNIQSIFYINILRLSNKPRSIKKDIIGIRTRSQEIKEYPDLHMILRTHVQKIIYINFNMNTR